MAVLTTRTFHRRQNDGNDAEVVLSIFEPVQKETNDWRCIFDFDPPLKPRNVAGRGMDWIQAFTHSLEYARLYFESQWSKTGHWQNMGHLGLPDSTREMPQCEATELPNLEATGEALLVQATRDLSIPNESGGVRKVTLSLYSPFPTVDGSWKCAFSFDPIDAGSIRYGVGVDFIESFLDALAAARRVFESMIPAGWTGSDDLFDCSDFPIKIGRAFQISRSSRKTP
ncbi:MAG TPA: hypothetical protein PK156_01725 [Polyangium sp.]|nr:hypothetical protein [Polyangium sp.]